MSSVPPYVFLGPARTSATRGTPIAITWELEHPMPTEFFTAATVVVAG